MGTNTNDIASLLHGLTLGDHPYSARNQLSFPREAIRGLDGLASTINSRARSVKAVIDDANNSSHPSIADVYSLHEQIQKLTKIALNLRTTIDDLTESTESSIVRHLTSLGTQGRAVNTRSSSIKELTSHFESTIKDIVREVLKSANSRDVMWRAAEVCYVQAVSPAGSLHADDYFDELEESCLEWPYDPDFDSERYYEHENRLIVDENYAAAFQDKRDHKAEGPTNKRQGWIDFWFNALHHAPNGPTLFYPPLSPHSESIDLEVPRYLFRTFDAHSSGQNDENVIASMANRNGPQQSNRVNILSKEKQEAARLLHMHLINFLFTGNQQDDLMSWTSSLLFAIQYAIWRAHKYYRHPSQISICAIDTSKFPLGQFVRDIPLIEACREAAEPLEREFFDFRLNNRKYYNGEYLSQGALNHSGRSCIMSLEQLIQAGLFQLYPDFEDAEGRKKWAKRVGDLREIWSAEQETTEREIQLARQVERDCFAQLGQIDDMASILLSFKHRKYSNFVAPAHFNSRQPGWADKPEEVHRYWVTSEAVKSKNPLQHDQDLLQGVFFG